MSTAITKALHKSIEDSVQRLLGHGKTAFPFPLDDAQQREFWHNTFDPNIVHAHHTLLNAGYVMYGQTWHHAGFEANIDSKIYHVKLAQTSSQERTRAFLIKFPETTAYPHLSHETLFHAMPNADINWPLFLQWCENCAIVDRDFSAALNTLKEVLEFCGTVGQLKRAIPDLTGYLPEKTQEKLSDQVRASNMPHAWASFDRKRIDNLQNSMAKAHLLPKTKANERWEEIDGTWSVYG